MKEKLTQSRPKAFGMEEQGRQDRKERNHQRQYWDKRWQEFFHISVRKKHN